MRYERDFVFLMVGNNAINFIIKQVADCEKQQQKNYRNKHQCAKADLVW